MDWDELVANVTARHPVRESKMFGMPCLKRENGKVVAGGWKDGGLTVKLVDEAQREAALGLPGAQLFDPGMGRAIQVAAKVGDQAPMAAVCCNACRTCTTTNLLALATGAGLGAVYAVGRFARRVLGSGGQTRVV